MQRQQEIHTYDDDGREVVVERPARRRGFAVTPSQVVSAVVGVVLVAFGIFAVARAGLDGPLDDPRVDVLGLSHTALIGLIEIGVGAVLILCAFGYATRVLSGLIWLGLLAAGLVLLAEPGDLVTELNTESQLGWLGVITGGVLVLAALLAPRPRTSAV